MLLSWMCWHSSVMDVLALVRYLLKKVGEARATKLPSETGGVLLGHFHMQHRVVYIVDTMPSPPDSKEEPTG